MDETVIAFADKTIVKITGLEVNGLKPVELEKQLSEYIGRAVRVIGVTGSSLQMDVYGLEPEAILLDEKGIIQAISAVPGLSASEITEIARAERAKAVSIEDLANMPNAACPKERRLPPK